MKQNTHEALTRLLADQDFKHIPTVANRFNIFDAVGMASQEIRHSTFLAFLLNPSGTHGIKNAFFRAFLQAVFADNINESSAAVHWFLDDAQVDREWKHIDIRVRLPKEQIVLVIENKVWSGEHSNQLERYYESVKTHHTGWRILPVYLTPGGSAPSDRRYKTVRYSTIVEILEHLLLLPDFKSKNSESELLLRHYVQLIRRIIVGGSELEELCRKVYLEHREAIDLINSYRPDTQAEMRQLIEELVSETDTIVILQPIKTQSSLNLKKHCLFVPSDWKRIVPDSATGSDNWTTKIFNFVIVNLPSEVYILLQLRPGSEQDRQRFFQIAKMAGLVSGTQIAKYQELQRWNLLTPADYHSTTPSALHEIVRSGWNDFVSEELPRVTEIFERGLRNP